MVNEAHDKLTIFCIIFFREVILDPDVRILVFVQLGEELSDCLQSLHLTPRKLRMQTLLDLVPTISIHMLLHGL